MAVSGRLPEGPVPSLTLRPKIKVRDNLFRVLAALSLTGLVLGVGNVGGEAASGLCLAFGAILFGLALIVKVVHKAEAAGNQSRLDTRD